MKRKELLRAEKKEMQKSASERIIQRATKKEIEKII
jgi:hypothetical protein